MSKNEGAMSHMRETFHAWKRSVFIKGDKQIRFPFHLTERFVLENIKASNRSITLVLLLLKLVDSFIFTRPLWTINGSHGNVLQQSATRIERS